MVGVTIDDVVVGLAGAPIARLQVTAFTAYRQPFLDPERLGRMVKLVEQTLKQKGAPEKTRITAVDISSFSAGYGAVRELLKSPENLKLIRRLVLTDSVSTEVGSA